MPITNEVLYCTPLRQNGLVESILSKMRILINEKTTMDFRAETSDCDARH